MAGNRIKGITVAIGGDTVGLQNALKDVNKKSKDLQKELKDVDKLLRLNPNNVELLAQRQQLLTQSVQATTEKLNALREAQRQVQQQFERGEINEEQYRNFRREIVDTEQSLQRLQQSMQDMDSEQQNLGQATTRLTNLFDVSGSSVEDYVDLIGTRLVRAIQNGTATSSDLEYAFARIGRSMTGARGDINRLRQAIDSIDDGNSIQAVRLDLQQLSIDANDAEEDVDSLGGALEGLAGALVAGGGIEGVVEKALSDAELNTKIDLIFDVPEESKKSIKSVIKTIETYGIEGEDALEGVRRQWVLNGTASDEVNAAIVKGAAVIASSYADIDFTELIQETGEIAKGFGISNENALALVSSLLKAGFPPDQIDIISEYGSQLKRAGYNAEEIQAVFEAGVDTKSWNIDVLLDGLKEGRIKLAEFGQGVDENTAKLLEGTGISAKQLEEWGKAVAKGGEGGKKAMSEVAQALVNVKDETQRNQLGVLLFGSLYEEQGSNITDVLINAKDKTVDLKDNQDMLNDSVKKLDSDPTVKLNQAMSDLATACAPVLTVVAEIISKFAEWISANPTLAGTIVAITIVLGILIGVFLAIVGVMGALATTAIALDVALLPLTLIILGIAAAIAACIAIGVYLYKNWDKLSQKAGELKEKLKSKFQEIKDNIVDKIKDAVGKVKDQVDKIKGFFEKLKLKLPHIKLPHFSLNGSFSLKPPSVPKLSVDWYKNGGVFAPNSPQLIGIGDHRTAQEAVLPLTQDVYRSIGKGISENMDGGNGSIIIQNMTVREEADIQKIARELYKLQKANARGKGVVMP